MDLSLELARILGPLFAVVGVGALLNAAHYREMVAVFTKDSGLYYFSGVLAFATGITLVLHHNVWTADWRAVITVIGWAALVRGTLRLIIPRAGLRVARSLIDSAWIVPAGGLTAIIIGAVLSFYGFRHFV